MSVMPPPAIDSRNRSLLSASGIALLGAGAVFLVGLIGGRVARGEVARWWPLAVLVLSLAIIITLITAARVHALLALILAALSVGLMSRVGSLPGEAASGHWLTSVNLATAGFGEMAGKIAVIIILASIIGLCLLESGAADRIVLAFLDLFGEKRAGLALLVATYVVSIPIFFDTIFMLLIPLAHVLYRRTGRDYTLYVLAICCAAAITHSMVIPHPGPAAMATELKIDAGLTLWVGLATGIIPLAAGWLASRWISRRVQVTPPAWAMEAGAKERAKPMDSLALSLVPVLLPVALIGGASFLAAFARTRLPGLTAAMAFFGNPNVALLIGTAFAMAMLAWSRGLDLRGIAQRLGPSLETAGMVILITSAGGAFGIMLRHAGVGTSIKEAMEQANLQVSPVLLAWLLALVIRVAQGSATVAMMTTVAMVQPMMAGSDVHPVCIFLAVGYGALGVSWMNDSGFWLVSRLGGFSESQTLRTWTTMVSIVSVAGLLTALALSMILR